MAASAPAHIGAASREQRDTRARAHTYFSRAASRERTGDEAVLFFAIQ
jgi:hypothetical protein